MFTKFKLEYSRDSCFVLLKDGCRIITNIPVLNITVFRKHCVVLDDAILSLLPTENVCFEDIVTVHNKPNVKAKAIKKKMY